MESHKRHRSAKSIEIRIFLDRHTHAAAVNRQNVGMKRPASPLASIAATWKLARSGDLRGAAEAARKALEELTPDAEASSHIELHLVAAFCAMRQGDHSGAMRELDAADHAASSVQTDGSLVLRVETWRAELAYFQGRYSAATEIIDRVLEPLEQNRDWAYAAFALRIRMAIMLARADYEGVAAQADRAIRDAKTSGDGYVMVQILNILGAFHFDCATCKLPEPHARAHLSSLDLADAAPMENDAREALRFFRRARAVAKRAHYEFAAWYVAGNIERLEIVLGHSERAVPAIRKRLKILQKRGARYDEIVTRSNLAWGLRILGQHREALHELDVALNLARETGTFNVLLEFLEYDRSIVLAALGDTTGAQASYRRYLRLVGVWNRNAQVSRGGDLPAAMPKRPLEPFFLKSADRFIFEHIGQALPVERVAKHCGVSQRTLEKTFIELRGITPVAYMRNLRLDHARRALAEGDVTVADVAARFGFRSSTTFALEYRKRFGLAPSRTRRARAGLVNRGSTWTNKSSSIPLP
jgi:AraC-like DNA-binding protein